MNYIRHLHAFYNYIKKDNSLTSGHVSLYLAMFQYWNYNRFQNPFRINRDDLMEISKIGSKNTYHKCVKELHQAGYIRYYPPTAKFQPVKISMIRMDIKEEQGSYKQLHLFNTQNAESGNEIPSLSLRAAFGKGQGFSPNIDTTHVPHLTTTSLKIDTATVPDPGQYIKDKHLKNESKPLAQKFSGKSLIQNQTEHAAHVPKSVHHATPTLMQAEEYFKENKYCPTEAKKFYNHYKATGWKIKGITPIEDWEAAAHKWMLNAAKYEDKKATTSIQQQVTLQDLYDEFQGGNNIFKQITTDHYDQLNLSISKSIMDQAKEERINQLTGSNQNSILQLLRAYQTNNENNDLLQKDKPNFEALAKKIAVIHHFYQIINPNPGSG